MRRILANVADDGRGLSSQQSPTILARSVSLLLGVNDLDVAWEANKGMSFRRRSFSALATHKVKKQNSTDCAPRFFKRIIDVRVTNFRRPRPGPLPVLRFFSES